MINNIVFLNRVLLLYGISLIYNQYHILNIMPSVISYEIEN